MSRNTESNSPVEAVTADLMNLRAKYPWIKTFTATKRGIGFTITMKASDHPLGQYNDLESIRTQLKKYGAGFIKKVHDYWWDRQLRRPRTDAGAIWDETVLNGTDSTAKAYLNSDYTASHIKSKYYDGTSRNATNDAFERYLFGPEGDGRKEVVRLLGNSALPVIKHKGAVAEAATRDTAEIIRSMRFLENEDTYGRYDPLPAIPGEREHTNFRPVSVDLQDDGRARVTTVKTAAGKTFTIRESDPARPMEVRVKGVDLRLKEPGDPRGVTQDSPGFLPNQNVNRAHIIADWFGGSGYKAAGNLVTTSDHYNQRVMGDAEADIASDLMAFAEEHGLERGQVCMDLAVTLTFGELLKDVFLANIASETWYEENDADSRAELARLTAILLNPPVRRVISVEYDYSFHSTISEAKAFPAPRQILSDDHLFTERSAT